MYALKITNTRLPRPLMHGLSILQAMYLNNHKVKFFDYILEMGKLGTSIVVKIKAWLKQNPGKENVYQLDGSHVYCKESN